MEQKIKERLDLVKQGKVPPGYKKTELGIVPEEWEQEKFCKLFSRIIERNNSGNTNILTISAQYGLISQGDFFNRNIASEDTSNYFLLRKGEFAYNKSYSANYPYGAIKPLIRYENGIVSPLYICFKSTTVNKCPSYYKHYFELGLMNHEIKSFAQEGARNHGLLNLSIDDFFNSILVYPPLDEQIKIAKILDTYEKMISKKIMLLKLKQQQKKWLMQVLLTGKKRLEGFNKKWGKSILKDIAIKCREKNTDLKYTTVFSNSAQHGVIAQEEQFDKDIANVDSIDKYFVIHENEFVYNPRISVTAPCGPINMNKTDIIGILSPLYLIFKIISTGINREYLRQYFKSTTWFKYMKSVANYGARHDRMSITDEDFFNMPINIPNLDEQTAIANVLTTADQEIELLEQDLQQWQLKKKALMQLLLTGIIRVRA